MLRAIGDDAQPSRVAPFLVEFVGVQTHPHPSLLAKMSTRSIYFEFVNAYSFTVKMKHIGYIRYYQYNQVTQSRQRAAPLHLLESAASLACMPA